jgi:hypothetical protein
LKIETGSPVTRLDGEATTGETFRIHRFPVFNFQFSIFNLPLR